MLYSTVEYYLVNYRSFCLTWYCQAKSQLISQYFISTPPWKHQKTRGWNTASKLVNIIDDQTDLARNSKKSQEKAIKQKNYTSAVCSKFRGYLKRWNINSTLCDSSSPKNNSARLMEYFYSWNQDGIHNYLTSSCYLKLAVHSFVGSKVSYFVFHSSIFFKVQW